MLNKTFYVFSKDQNLFVNQIKKKYSFSNIIKIISQLKELNVLLIGETIIDNYVFCDALGKSGKESVLVLRELRSEKYLGGVLAIGQNLVDFVKSVTIISFFGNESLNKKFIKKHIDKRIKIKFLNKKNSPTIIKKRFIDDVDKKKILGVYTINDDNLSLEEEKKFIKTFDNIKKNKQITIVSDYGHGMITDKIADYITKKSKKISINAQVNAANTSFHNIRKFKNFDTLVINATELRHEMRERGGNLLTLAKKLIKDLNVKNIVVTKGINGVVRLSDNMVYECPAFTDQVVDKIGAGDALFGIYSLFINNKQIGKDLPLFISSLAAAQNIKEMGNRKPVNKINLLKSIEYMFK